MNCCSYLDRAARCLLGAIVLSGVMPLQAQEGMESAYADWILKGGGKKGEGTFPNGAAPNYHFQITGDFNPDQTFIQTEVFHNWVWEEHFGRGYMKESLRFGRDDSADLDIAVVTIDFEAPVEASTLAIALTDLDTEDALLAASLGGVPIPTKRVADWFQGRFDSSGGLNFPSGFDEEHAAIVAQFDPDGRLSDESFEGMNPGSESASGWFIPSEKLDRLTVTFRDRSGEGASMHIYMAASPEPILDLPSLRESVGPVAQSSGPLHEPVWVELGVPLWDEVTYEFFFRATETSGRVALIGDEEWSIDLDQGTGMFGLSGPDGLQEVFGREDIPNQSVYGEDVHVVVGAYWSVSWENGKPTHVQRNLMVFVNGRRLQTMWDTGFTYFSQAISLMAFGPELLFPMGEGSVLHGWAIYNKALPKTVLNALTIEPFPGPGPMDADSPTLGLTRTPSGSTLMIGSLPNGTTANVEYSPDLRAWQSLATGVGEIFEDTDPARSSQPSGYYRLRLTEEEGEGQ